jgi:hypothetical protein
MCSHVTLMVILPHCDLNPLRATVNPTSLRLRGVGELPQHLITFRLRSGDQHGRGQAGPVLPLSFAGFVGGIPQGMQLSTGQSKNLAGRGEVGGPIGLR